MPRPRGDNPAPAPTSAPQNAGQPASVPNRAKMATYVTDMPDSANPPEGFDMAARLTQVMPSTNPITGETSGGDVQPQSEQPTQTPAPQTAGQPEPEPAVPDKYKGKTADELIRMHQEAEKAMHSRDEEIRVARTYLDRFVTGQAQPAHQQAKPVEQTSPADAGLPADDVKMLEMMLSKPTQFVDAVAQRIVGGLQQKSASAEAARIFNEHRAEVQTEQFGRFIASVPKHIVAQADSDPAVMQFLINSYRGGAAPATPAQRQPSTDPVAVAERQREMAARTNAARTVSGAAPGAQPTFTRMQLMNMMVNEPEKYEALQPQILAAYANGLVGD